jgi:hypothetical protein
MADAETLRVQVQLSPDLHPELFGAVAGLRPRGRAERLRQLALMGLSSSGRAGEFGVVAETAQAAPEDPNSLEAEALSPARARLLAGLTLAD